MIRVNFVLSFVILIFSMSFKSQNLDSLNLKLTSEKNVLKKIILLGKITENCPLKDIKLYCDQSISLIKKIKTTSNPNDLKQITIEEARVYHHLGYYFYKLSLFTKSQSFSMQSVLLLEKNHLDSTLLVNAYNNLASVYISLNKYNDAISIFRKNISYDNSKNNQASLSLDYNNLSSAFRQINKNDSAIFYAKKSLFIKQKLSSKFELINSYNLLSTIYFDNKTIDSAEFYNQKGIELSLKLNYYKPLQLLYYWKGMIELAKNNKNNAQQFLLKSLQNVSNETNLKSVFAAHFELYKVYNTSNNYKEALFHYTQYKTIKDSVASEALQKESEINQLKFDYSQKETILKQQQEKELALTTEEKKRQNVIIVFSTLLIIIITGFLIFSLNRARILNKQKKFIQLQKDLLHQKQEELVINNTLLNKKNSTITDNITYAQVIQHALIPTEQSISIALNKQCFVLFMPKDIVSGDFYWSFTKNNQTLLILADCTGHGVSGAFISILAIKALEKIVSTTPLSDVVSIIKKLHSDFILTFNSNSQNYFGIELVVATFNFSQNVVYITGSSNSVLYIQNNQSQLLKFDNKSIGNPSADLINTQVVELNLVDVTSIYMFTDGYQDQKGGENNRRFQSNKLKDTLFQINNKNVLEQKNILASTFNQWKGSHEQVDDVSVIGIKLITN